MIIGRYYKTEKADEQGHYEVDHHEVNKFRISFVDCEQEVSPSHYGGQPINENVG